MADPIAQLLLRIPPELKTKIEEAAKENQRSINFEATRRLEQSFNPASSQPLIMVEFHGENLQKFFGKMMRRLEADGFPTDHLIEVLKEFQSEQDNKKAP